LKIINGIGTGGLWDAFVGKLVLLVGRWQDLFITVRFPKVLGMFVLGLWLARRSIPMNMNQHRPLLVKWRRIGLGLGLPLNLGAALALAKWPYLPPTVGALLGVAGQGAGFPLLALGYASTIALAAMGANRFVGVFGPVGRMALTNYLTHSIVCVTLSYGFGFGLWTRIGALQAWGIAILIVLLQIPLSTWWLSRFRYGPAEWVWRRLTYGQPLPMRGPS